MDDRKFLLAHVAMLQLCCLTLFRDAVVGVARNKTFRRKNVWRREYRLRTQLADTCCIEKCLVLADLRGIPLSLGGLYALPAGHGIRIVDGGYGLVQTLAILCRQVFEQSAICSDRLEQRSRTAKLLKQGDSVDAG